MLFRALRYSFKSKLLGDGTPPVSRQAKLLGCMIDSKLSFIPHIRMITSKMEDVAFKLKKMAGTTSSVSPFELYTIFKSYIFPRGEYASCIWIFRVFLPYKRVFYKEAQNAGEIFNVALKPMFGYAKPWTALNRFYIDCMRRIIGANESPSSVAVLVRMGVMPLQYEFAYRAILWYIKITKGETDQVLTDQLDSMSSDEERFARTCFYQHCHNYIEELSKVGGLTYLIVSRKSVRKRLGVRCS